MKFTVVVPAKDEAATLGPVLESVRRVCEDVLLVDGHSKDATAEIARSQGVTVILDNRKGKGDAIRSAIPHVRGDIVVFIDADGSHDPQDIQALITPIAEGKADLVIGSRMRGGSDELHGTPFEAIRLIGSTIITQVINLRFGANNTDYQNGFRAIRMEVLRALRLREDITTIEQEMAIKTLKLGYSIVEVPSHEYARRGGQSKIRVLKVWHRYLWELVRDCFLW